MHKRYERADDQKYSGFLCSRWFGGQAEVVLAAPLVKAKVVRVNTITMIKVMWRTIVKMVMMFHLRKCKLRQNWAEKVFPLIVALFRHSLNKTRTIYIQTLPAAQRTRGLSSYG